jgi:hypothetical protein
LFMTTQVHNVFYHVFMGLYFWDYSPGTVTALLLYIPVNFFIGKIAFREKWISKTNIIVIFILGAISFWAFEMLGPILIAVILGIAIIYVIISEVREKNNED